MMRKRRRMTKYVSSAYCQEPWAHTDSSGHFYSVRGLSFLHDTGPLPTTEAFAGFAGARLPDPSDLSVIDKLSDAWWPSLEDHRSFPGSGCEFGCFPTRPNFAGFPSTVHDFNLR